MGKILAIDSGNIESGYVVIISKKQVEGIYGNIVFRCRNI